ncbi:MAG: glycosyltransferase family 4 protein [Planctomycetota bacterium]|nr:glycosyltransferase family 4 protein [Planctomycetota bacterium]
MPARIAYLLEYPTVSGGERSLLCLLDHLDRSRFVPVLFAPKQGPMAQEIRVRGLAHVPYEMNAAGRRRPFDEVQKDLAGLLLASEISLLHGNSLSCAEYTGLVGEEAGLPAVAHVRDIQKLKASRRGRLVRNKKLIAVSHGTRDHLVGQGLSESLVEVVWNGIPEKFCDAAEVKSPLWPGWEPGMRVIANIGQICLRKAQDLCLEAMIPLLKADSELHLLFVGERFSKKAESVRFEESLHERTEDEALGQQIHFTAYRDDVPAILGETLLLAHSAHQEPLGRVLLEAQISGVPVVGMTVGGNQEVVESGRTGLLVPKGEVEAFRQAVSKLLNDDKMREEMGQRARRRATERFDPERSAAGVMDIYDTIL